MPVWFRAAGIGGSLLILIALLITFLKQLIAFIGFISVAFKILIVVVFIAVIVGVGYLVLRSLNETRRRKDL